MISLILQQILISNPRKPIYDATHVNVIVLARNKKKLSEI